jgi:hypothetical protein
MASLKRTAQTFLHNLGYDVRRVPRGEAAVPPDFDDLSRETIRQVRPFTMTSAESLGALVDATRYITAHGIAGAIVECGVWRGGSMMAVALSLRRLGAATRKIYLFDTFEGMPRPAEVDRSQIEGPASRQFARLKRSEDSSDWCRSTIEEVKANMGGTGYPEDQFVLVKGKVEETLPQGYPGGPIALLRLDTDWYQSTHHELVHLYPLLVPGGILIIDDYGHWEGARKAVDEYFAQLGSPIFLHRIDYTARLVVKPPR